VDELVTHRDLPVNPTFKIGVGGTKEIAAGACYI